jgi:hypothetical protein
MEVQRLEETEEYPIYNHNWRNISTKYIYNKTNIKISLVQGSPTDCSASFCVIKKPHTRGGCSLL